MSDTSGKVIVLLVEAALANVNVVPVPAMLVEKFIFFVESKKSTIWHVDATRDLFSRVSVVARPTRVSVDVGRVNVPVLLIVAIIGAVSVLVVRV